MKYFTNYLKDHVFSENLPFKVPQILCILLIKLNNMKAYFWSVDYCDTFRYSGFLLSPAMTLQGFISYSRPKISQVIVRMRHGGEGGIP
jgi:hypothetical protein